MNRYYRPSAPRYTSQFVEEQYPMDLILQAGAMKYQNKQKMASDIAQLSSIANTLPAGYRTQELAPQVRQKWDQRINDTIGKFATNYDSPQALMEFTRMKSEFQRDPAVNLIRMDYEQGNKEWEEIRKSPTLALDINPNVYKNTNMLKQFNYNEDGSVPSYRGYQPLVKYADVPERVLQEMRLIEPQKRSKFSEKYVNTPVGPERRMTNTTYEYRDPTMINDKLTSMADRVISKSEPWAAYHYEDLRRRMGKEPTKEDIVQSLLPHAQSSMVMNETGNTTTDLLSPEQVEALGYNNGQQRGTEVPLAVRTDTYTNNNVSRLKSLRTLNTFSGGKADPLKTTDENINQSYKLSRQNPNMIDPNGNNRDKINTLIDDTEAQKYNKSNFNENLYEVKQQKEQTNKLLANSIVNGIVSKEGGSSEWLDGAVVFDYETGQNIQNTEDKRNILKPGEYAVVRGEISDNTIAEAPVPAGYILQTGSGKDAKTYIVKRDDQKNEDNKVIWNYKSYIRAKDTGIGNGFILRLGSDGNNKGVVNLIDGSDAGMNFDENNLPATNSNELFIKPLIDYTDNGKIKIKVYAMNPELVKDVNNSGRYKASGAIAAAAENIGGHSPLGRVVDTAQEALMYGMNNGILDNTNPAFLGEYEIDGKTIRNVNDAHLAILNDREKLFNAKSKYFNSINVSNE